MWSAEEIIAKLKLSPLPQEGGYYRETYRSSGPSLSARQLGIPADSLRPISTAIYYFVTPDSFSALHRVRSDEIFHFYGGDSVEMIQIDGTGKLERITLGSDFMQDEAFQVVVPKGVWQGLKLKPSGKWALMGTTVAPGFEFEDFELGKRELLLAEFPRLRTEIVNFTRGDCLA